MKKESPDVFGPLRTHLVDVEPKPRKRGRGNPEERAQREWVKWARAEGLEFAHLNNGSKSKVARIRLHAMGCAAGAADILVFDYTMALEFKSPTGTQSDDQKSWQGRIEKLGWGYYVVRSKSEAVEICGKYGRGEF